MTTSAAAPPDKHTIRWYGVIAGAADHSAAAEPGMLTRGRDLLSPRTSHMNDRDWGWDVVCSCGWESRSGGGMASAVRRSIADHRSDVEWASR